MTAVFRSGSSVSSGSGGPDFTLAVPPGAAVGDLLVCSMWTTEQNPGIGAWISTPDFTDLFLIGSSSAFGSNRNIILSLPISYAEFWWWGYRIVDGTEVSFPFHIYTGNHALDGLLPANIVCACYTGVDPSTPFLLTDYPGTSGSGGGISLPPITAPLPNTLTVDFVLQRGSASPHPIPAPAVGTVDAVDDLYSTTIGATLLVPPPGVMLNDTTAPPIQEDIFRVAADECPSATSIGDSIANGITSIQRDWIPQFGGARWNWATMVLKDGGTYVAPTNVGTVSLVSTTTHGTLTLLANGQFTYIPDAGYAGHDSFVYRLTGSLGGIDDAVATIRVTTGAVFHGRLKIGV